jgi:WD40 repeat protein
VTANGIEYLPCFQSNDEQVVSAFELYCSGQHVKNSQCTRREGYSVCKCSNDIRSQTLSSTATLAQSTLPQTTTTTSSLSASLLLNSKMALTGHSNWINCIIVLNNGDFASGSHDSTIIIWDSINYSKKRILNNTCTVLSLAILTDNHLASASADKTIKIWNPQSGILKMTLIGHTGSVKSLALLSDDSLASASSDETIKIWNTTTGQLKKTINVNKYIISMAPLPNDYLAIGGYFSQIQIWDTIAGDIKHNISTEFGYIYSLKVLKNGGGVGGGDQMASTYYSNNEYGIQIWDLFSFALLKTYTGHSGLVDDIVELPNGDLASASSDKTIKIWDKTTGNVKNTFLFHTRYVLALAVLKNGLLASGSAEATIVISNISNTLYSSRSETNAT